MKKAILSVTIALTSLFGNSQVFQFEPNSKQFQTLSSHSLTVVETGNEEFDVALHKAFDAHWQVTKLEYVSYDDFKKNVSDVSKSFFIPMNITLTFSTTRTRSGVNSTTSYDKIKFWYGIINGGKKTWESYSDNDVIILSPLGLYTGEEDINASIYRLDYVAKAMNDAVQGGIDKTVNGKYLKSTENINKGFVAIAKTKTLVINKDAHSIALGKDRGQTTETKAFEKYPYKYKFVSDEEFKEIMAGDSEEYICLVPIIEVNKHILVYEPSTKNTVYYGWQMQGLEVKAKDVNSMSLGEN